VRELAAAVELKAFAVSGVSRRFSVPDGPPITALDGVSLDIAPGEFVSLVGPSGCGKSTLLRLLGGLDRPDMGTIAHNERPIAGPFPGVVMVFQQPTLLPWRSVLDNVLLPIELMGEARSRHAERARALLETVGLAGFADRRPHELSGGMQQRVGICRALIHDPRVLLMDEPFAALDLLTREEMTLELARICQLRPVTVVFVTHSIAEAVMLSDRVAVMSPRPGRIVEMIKIDLPRPRTPEVEIMPAYIETVSRIKAHIYHRGLGTRSSA
jgi:NitT/TauT family transport system ATP-binding protein